LSAVKMSTRRRILLEATGFLIGFAALAALLTGPLNELHGRGRRTARRRWRQCVTGRRAGSRAAPELDAHVPRPPFAVQ
jgi:hypothetical protein